MEILCFSVEETDAVRNVKIEAAFKLLCSGRPELIAHGVAMLPNGKVIRHKLIFLGFRTAKIAGTNCKCVVNETLSNFLISSINVFVVVADKHSERRRLLCSDAGVHFGG